MAVRANPTSYAVTSTTAVRYQVASAPAFPSATDWSIAIWHGPDNATGSITEFIFDVGNATTGSADTFHLYFWEASSATPRKYQFAIVGSEGTASSHTVTSTNAVTADGTWRLIVINYVASTKTFALKICPLGGSVSAEGSTTKSDFSGIAAGELLSFFRREVDDLRGQRNPAAEYSYQAQVLSDATIEAMAAGASITAQGITPVLYFPFTTAQQTQTNQGSASSSDATAANGSDIGSTVTHPFSTGPTSYALTGPASGLASTASGLWAITTNATVETDTVFTLASTDAGDVFRNSADSATITTVTITTGNDSAQFRLLPDATTGNRTVSVTDDQSLTDPSGEVYEVVSAATALVLSPSNLSVQVNDASSTVTVSLDGGIASNVSVTLSSDGSGTFSNGGSCTLEPGDTDETFTYTPTDTAGSPHTITATATGLSSDTTEVTVTDGPPNVTLSEPEGGCINLDDTTVTDNGSSPLVTLVLRGQACTDISATVRSWGFLFVYEADQETTPEFDMNIDTPEWHLSLLGDSLTAWRVPYSLDGGLTWQRMSTQGAGTHANGSDANHRHFSGVSVPANTPCIIGYDIVRRLQSPGGTEDTLSEWIADHPTKFAPGVTAAALSTPAYTPAYSPSVLPDYIAWMTTSASREDGQNVPSRPSYLPILEDPALSPDWGNPRVALACIAGGHPFEGVGRAIFIAMMNRILTDDSVGNALRKYLRIPFNPNVNEAGEQGGYWRSTPEQVARDYNRHFDSSTATVTNRIMAAFLDECDGYEVAGWLDFHGEGNSTPTIYGRQTNVPYQRLTAKLQALRASYDLALDADDGKRSWNWAIKAKGDGGLGARVAVIIERETIGTPNDADRVAMGEEIAVGFKQYLDENLIWIRPMGAITPGVAVEVRFVPAGGGLLPDDTTYDETDITPSATNGSFGAVTYVSSGGKQYWTADFTADAVGAVTMSFTNTQDLLSAGTLATGTAVATRGGAGRGMRRARH